MSEEKQPKVDRRKNPLVTEEYREARRRAGRAGGLAAAKLGKKFVQERGSKGGKKTAQRPHEFFVANGKKSGEERRKLIRRGLEIEGRMQKSE